VSGTDGHCDGPVCITCSDQAAQVVVAWVDGATAGIRDPGAATATVDVSLVDPVEPGDQLLVHAGIAIARLGDDREVTT
jgi:hydrogenase maturation factor